MTDSTLSNNHENKFSSMSLLSSANNSSKMQQNPKNILHSIIFRGMIFFQIIAYGSYSVLVHLCEKDGQITFSSATMNFMIEFIKLFFSLNAFIYFQEIHFNKIQILSCFKKSLPYSIPAILYFLNNNLAVHMQLHMDPASYQILSNFKIITTAILYRLIIKQKLTKRQWFALTLLFFGGFAYSLGTLKNSSFISKTIVDSTLVMREMYIRPLGIPMIIIYCSISGLAGVYNEWILKKNFTESLHLQNIFLYTYGTIFNLIPAISIIITRNSQNGNSYSDLFHGFSFYTWLIVFTQALNGLFMSVVIKYSSNIIRLFVISFSLIVTTVLSFFIYHINFNMYFFASFITMTCALSLYYTN
ncbi:unnamed protein product [Adineta steineri]|uniref:UDP-sugar transporter protein SLC35A4 n=1 Tax=Adineta steineri TaxID=433720 RepID=A0A813N2G4_9BILA|nr:unnamed protein product [Adineta steineri]